MQVLSDHYDSNLAIINASGRILATQDNGDSWSTTTHPVSAGSAMATEDRPGPNGGHTRFYVAGSDNQVRYSDNLGLSWSTIGPTLPEAIRSMASHGMSLVVTSANDVYRLSGDGSQWLPSDSGLSLNNNQRLTSHAQSPALFLTTGGAAFRSLDGGANWTEISNGTNGEALASIAVDANGGPPSTLYANSYSGAFFRSTDGGDQWLEVPLIVDGMPATHPAYYTRAHPTQSGTLFIGTLADDAPLRISENGGDTWRSIHHSLFGRSVYVSNFSPVDPLTVWVSAGALMLRSVDGGDSWQERSQGIDGESGAFAIDSFADSPDHLIAVGPGSAISASMDAGINWQVTRNFGLIIHDFLVLPDSNNVALLATQNGLFRTQDAGLTWTELGTADGVDESYATSLASSPAHPQRVMAILGQRVFLSNDEGASWGPLQSSEFLKGGFPLREVAIDAINPDVVYLSSGTLVFVSTDAGQTYDPPIELNQLFDVRSLKCNPYSSGDIFARTDILHRSTDFGATWNVVNISTLQAGEEPQDVMVDAIDQNKIWVAGEYAIHMSENNGLSWQTVNSGLTPPDPQNPYDFISQDPREPDHWYTSSDSTGLWRLTLGGIFADQFESPQAP